MQVTDRERSEECDVRDKEKLADYRCFHRQWIEMLNGEDDHAIWKQITAVLSADLEYRTICRARELSDKASNPQNGMVHWFIDVGFIAHQVLAIRRVTEPYRGRKWKWKQYSVPRIISEIEDHRDLLTREVYVCVDGDPYDAPVSELRHRRFDELSRVAPNSRTRDDLIDPDYFKELHKRLASSKKVRTFSHEVLAHAADPKTRGQNVELSLRDLDNAYKDLVFLANQLSGTILWNVYHKFLPAYVCDMLKDIDRPICPESKVEELRQYWTKREEELRQLEREPAT